MPVPPVYRKDVSVSPPVVAAASGINADPLESMSYDELYALAQERNIHGRSDMRKEDLIEALR